MARNYRTLQDILGVETADTTIAAALSSWQRAGLGSQFLSDEEWQKAIGDSEGSALFVQNKGRVQAANTGFQRYLETWDPSLDYLKNAPVATKTTGGGNADAITRELSDLVPKGYDIKNKAGDTEAQIKRIAPDLARFGVQSLGELKPVEVPSPTGQGTKTVFFNTRTGMVLPENFGSSMAGKGGSDYRLLAIGDKVVPVAAWRNTSDKADIVTALSLATMGGAAWAQPLLAAQIGTAMSAGAANIAAGAIVGGASQGALAAASGGNVGKAVLTGAVTGAVGPAIGAANPGGKLVGALDMAGTGAGKIIGNVVNRTLTGAVGAGLGAALNSGDAEGGALRGAITGFLTGVGSEIGGAPGAAFAGQIGKIVAGSIGSGGGSRPGGPSSPAPGASPPPPAPDQTTPPPEQASSGMLAYGGAPQFGIQRGIRRA